MNRARILIAATAMVTLSASLACAGGTSSGSIIINGQIDLQSQFSNLTGNVDAVRGDAVVQSAAAGNLIDITTMNNTRVQNSQIVGPNAAIGTNVIANVSNIGGSTAISGQ